MISSFCRTCEKSRTHYLINLADKVLLDNRLTYNIGLARSIELKLVRYMRVQTKARKHLFFLGI